ncbi:MAG: exodeoxyribonuclease VII large subunit [Anaerolineae bacterium]|nr:exodeoxyribonuclease VII large subunit [Anaerolineae bacterium]
MMINQQQLELFSQTNPAYTVSEITARIRTLLEREPAFQNVWVTGEVSNFSRASSGHIYFTLKDAGAQLSCVVWRNSAQRMSYLPRAGDQVSIHGRIGLYEPGGRYQFYTDLIQSAGRGSLYQEYERLKAQLESEGLFDPARKRSLPPFPKCIGVVTSPTAAAFRDVLNVLSRRYPLARVLLSPTLVQGDLAPPRIVAALTTLNQRADVDVILVVRGGGSLEDLWAFNDERVARAVAASHHPVVSGVGHETDFTLTDFAADMRAPTPSAAAEVVTPDIGELRSIVWQQQARLEHTFNSQLDTHREHIAQLTRALHHLSPAVRLANAHQRIDDLLQRANVAVSHRVKLSRQQLTALKARWGALNPEAVLTRGYAIVRDRETGHVITSVQQAIRGQALTIQVQDGDITARAEERNERGERKEEKKSEK